MKNLFLFSGLGADKRVFDFLDLSGYNVRHIDWINPLPVETLPKYAKRLSSQISGKNPILIGVSFGGMVALEVAKLVSVEKIILISSSRSRSAIPVYMRFIKNLRLDRLIRIRPIKRPNLILYWLFGVTAKEHKILLTAIMKDTDEYFFSWAVKTIPGWKNDNDHQNVIQIHGTNDKILAPLSADYLVAGGGHLMVVTHAKEVTAILKRVLG
jgi:pimeloyl-ACP methyl ester carboxylesterase